MKKAILESIKHALAKLVESDAFLIKAEVNERSITHQLAVHLADEFKGLHVDCEYNRMFKNGHNVPKRAVRRSGTQQVSIADLNARTAYPDIIVHRREDDAHNLLILEAKKSGADVSEDYEKLNGFMASKNDKGLGYEFSAFVTFNTDDPADSSVEVKQQGEKW